MYSIYRINITWIPDLSSSDHLVLALAEMFAKLPHDIVILVLASLGPYELAAVAQTCSFLHGLVC